MEVRPLAVADRPALARLMIEMQQHYAVAAPHAADIESDLASLPAGVEILVAVTGPGDLVGFAGFSTLYPGSILNPQLYLKELYVAERARGQGAGRRLIRALARLAEARGCTRVDWTAERDNPAARGLYDALGARMMEKKICYRLDGDALAAAASGD
jgi:ribosomal protein S18 acetylase RimI-like enzyme